jgi:hypothetical protein
MPVTREAALQAVIVLNGTADSILEDCAFDQQACARYAYQALRSCGIDVQLMSVRVQVSNEAYAVQRSGLGDTSGDMSAPWRANHGFEAPYLLSVVNQDLLVDVSAPLLSAPEHGVRLPALASVAAPGFIAGTASTVYVSHRDNSVVMYRVVGDVEHDDVQLTPFQQSLLERLVEVVTSADED